MNGRNLVHKSYKLVGNEIPTLYYVGIDKGLNELGIWGSNFMNLLKIRIQSSSWRLLGYAQRSNTNSV